MDKRFEEGKSYIFTREKYIEDFGSEMYTSARSWVDKCDKKEVIVTSAVDGVVEGFYVSPSWCECIDKYKGKKFRGGLIYVFTKKKYIQRAGRKDYSLNKSWVDKCNGQRVFVLNSCSGMVGKTTVVPEWCKCIGRLK